MVNKLVKRCSYYVIKELEMKTMRLGHIPIRMAIIQKLSIPGTVKEAEQKNCHSLLVGIQNGTATLQDSLAVSYKAKHRIII